MADVRCVEGRCREPADGDRYATAGQLVEEGRGSLDLSSRRAPVRDLVAGMGRDDVPEQHFLLDAERGENAMDDGGRRLRGA